MSSSTGRPADRRVCVLAVFDRKTGAATRPVGVVGVQADRNHISWVPLEPAADEWKARLRPSADHSMRELVEFWAQHCNGVTLAVQPVDCPSAGTLVDAVEATVDGLLCPPGGEVRAGGQ